LEDLTIKGFKKILLYGAGEVAEIILKTLEEHNIESVEIPAVIDDDENKQNKKLINTPVLDILSIPTINHDGILISSYKANREIVCRLKSIDYDESKILKFF